MSETPQSDDAMAVDPASPEFERKVIGLIAKKKKLDPSAITAAATFQELGIDSMDGINILFALENEFDVTIPDEQAKQIHSIREMVQGIEKLVSQASASKAQGQ